MSNPALDAPVDSIFQTEIGQSLPAIWQRLHDNNSSWTLLHTHRPAKKNLIALDNIDLKLLKSLEKCLANRWISLCVGAGQTQIGAVGLSWCSDATLSDVWSMWMDAKKPLMPNACDARPVRLLNPALLNEEHQLSAILRTYHADSFSTCVHIIRAGRHLDLDLDPTTIPRIPREIAGFIFEALHERGTSDRQYLEFINYWPEFLHPEAD